jgi:hypothetical protein
MLVLRRAAAALTRFLRFALPLLTGILLRAVAGFRWALPRAAVALSRALRFAAALVPLVPRVVRNAAPVLPKRTRRPSSREDDRAGARNVAAAVTEWVQSGAPSSDEPATVERGDVDEDAGSGASSATTEPDDGVALWAGRGAVVLLAAVIAAVAVTTVLHGRHRSGHVAQAQRHPAMARLKPFPGAKTVPSRTSFSDPRAYAAAMTRLALASGRTEVDGAPACNENSTWDRWTCLAKGKPTLGAYAGHWLTYRCSPAVQPQPGGRSAGVMINCKPTNPPSLTT